MSLRTTTAALSIAMSLACAPGAARASSAAGIQITVGKFKLRVLFSAVLDYPDGSDRAIRDPRAVLHAVASLVQSNAERFGAIDHDLTIELGMRSGSKTVQVAVAEDLIETAGHPTRKYLLLGEAPVQADLRGQVIAAICARYSSACSKPATGKVTLFECPTAPRDGQISFGSFPSTSLNERFCLLQPKGHEAKAFVVTDQQMSLYYEPLD